MSAFSKPEADHGTQTAPYSRIGTIDTMEPRNAAVFGTYKDTDDIDDAVGALIIKGFPSEAISTLIPARLAVSNGQPDLVILNESPARAVARRVLRGTVGLLADLRAISLPEFGILVGAGPLMRSLASERWQAPPGAIAGVLQEMGAPGPRARRYEQILKRRALLSVGCPDSESLARAKRVLEKTGAQILSSVVPGGTHVPLRQLKVLHGGASF